MRIFLIVMIIFLAGCSNLKSIKIGGSYEGISGETEWTFSDAESKKAGTPVLVDKNGVKLYLIPEKQIQSLGRKEKK